MGIIWYACNKRIYNKPYGRYIMSKIEPAMKRPSLFRRTVMGLVYTWRRVMDVRYNPLKYVPDPSLQTYFMLVLFVVWLSLIHI